MTTKDEALRIALRALEEIDNDYVALTKRGHEAVAAIKQAQQAQEPVEPVAWFAFADSNGPVPLELYGWDEKACKHAVLTNARSVGWKGTLDGYLYQQGWTIKPVYAEPAPKQAEPKPRTIDLGRYAGTYGGTLPTPPEAK